MTAATLLCLVLGAASLEATPTPAVSYGAVSVETVWTNRDIPWTGAIVRAQSPGNLGGSPSGTTGGPTTFAQPGGLPPASSYAPGIDPFLGLPGDPYGSGGVYPGVGPVGPQPYRFGLSPRMDIAYLPGEATSGGRGDFEVTEFNLGLRKTEPWADDLIFSWTPEFNMRLWQGPDLVHFPGQVYRFASDFELATSAQSPISLQLGFTPALISDFESSLNMDSFAFDARAIVFLRANPELLVGLGVMYWDRVDDILLPYAGVVWTPNDRWEFRLMFPKARISYFVGDWFGGATWLYGSFEYNVEAYHIGLPGPAGKHERVQIRDYRAMLGIRTENAGVTTFLEGGWVFDRDVDFKYGTPGFGINDGFIARLGLRF